MWKTAVIAAALGGFLAISGSPACAGILVGDSTECGPVSRPPSPFTAPAGGSTYALNVEVDYCVYAALRRELFDLSFGSGADPSHGTQYVYAYQILNNLARLSVADAGLRYLFEHGAEPDETSRPPTWGSWPLPEGGGHGSSTHFPGRRDVELGQVDVRAEPLAVQFL